MTCGHLLDDRPEITIVPLESALVFRDEPLEMMEKHLVENGTFRMTRTVDSRHIGNEESRNAPGTRKGKNPGATTRNGRKHTPKSVENRQPSLTQDLERKTSGAGRKNNKRRSKMKFEEKTASPSRREDRGEGGYSREIKGHPRRYSPAGGHSRSPGYNRHSRSSSGNRASAEPGLDCHKRNGHRSGSGRWAGTVHRRSPL